MESEKKLKTFLGVDWGIKRIGLALGNSENRLASPYGTVGDIGEIIAVAEREKVDFLIVGKPFKMSNTNIKVDSRFEKFLKVLEERINIPIILFDERLSSRAADALSGTKKSKAGRDALAAMLILQDYFDSESE